MTLLAVEISQLFEVVWVSLGAGVGITACYSLVVYSTGRYMEAQRLGRRGAAMAYAVLAGLLLLVFMASVVLGVQIMLTK
jgi:phosphatidylglycerophosphate synthase